MIRTASLALSTALLVPPAAAEDAPSPNAIVAQAAADEWVAIAPHDLLVMDLAPASDGEARRVVIQLIPAPFSQGWVDNIRTLARAHWWDGTSVNRVQDNYVAQWGDATETKPLPAGLKVMEEGAYTVLWSDVPAIFQSAGQMMQSSGIKLQEMMTGAKPLRGDAYAAFTQPVAGWPLALEDGDVWPVHCYATVGVGRNLSPDTGTGAELYAVIGHAPRHLDRNIAVVGRVLEGIEHLSSLPRGKGDLGFYVHPSSRVSINSIRLASDLAVGERPRLEYLSTEGPTFVRYADARANRRDPFFIVPAGGADICNIPVPVRRVPG